MIMAQRLPMWLRDVTQINRTPSMPEWLLQQKERAFHYVINEGMPNRKQEQFKYTDFSFLANKSYEMSKVKEVSEFGAIIDKHRVHAAESICLVMVNGVFQPEWSDLASLPSGVTVMRLADAISSYDTLLNEKWDSLPPCYFASLNEALFIDGLFLSVEDNTVCKPLIHILSISTEQADHLLVPRSTAIIGKQATLNVLEDYISVHNNSYFNNCVMDWHVSPGARVHLYKKQNECARSAHVAHTYVHQENDSHFELVNVTTGGLFSRDDVIVHLNGSGASCSLSGYYALTQAGQYVDHHVEINHNAPNSQSEMLYKGTLDHASRAVFNGRLHVAKGAQGIQAYQANHNLLLSKDAEAYSKPELEIYADDVKCKHGATTGQLDEDALFYLRARGISHSEAIAILLQGYAEEILKQITHPAWRAHMSEAL